MLGASGYRLLFPKFRQSQVIDEVNRSRHTTIAVDLISSPSRSSLDSPVKLANVRLIEKIFEVENVTDNVVIVADGLESTDVLFEFSEHLKNQGKINSFITINSHKTMNELEKLHGGLLVTPILLIEEDSQPVIAIERDTKLSNPVIVKAISLKNADSFESVPKLAQILVNFLDWIHPR